MTGLTVVDHLAQRRTLARVLLAACPGITVVGSVIDGRADPSDLDVVVPPTPEAVAQVLDALAGLGGWWPTGIRPPRTAELLAAGFGRCTTRYGPVDLFVREPW